MNYQESLEYLEELNTFGVKLGLSRIERLAELLGHPERKYDTIHITGTNGKGSVSCMTAGILTASGLRTGLYTSPHLFSYTERCKVDGKEISEEEFAAAFRDALGLSKQMNQQAKTIQIEQKQFILEYTVQHIAYIEAFGKKLVIHTISRLSGIKEDTISGYTLSGLLALLDDPEFVQCHKSYVVNKSHIEKIDKSGRKIFLKGFSDAIPIGNKYQAELWG